MAKLFGVNLGTLLGKRGGGMDEQKRRHLVAQMAQQFVQTVVGELGRMGVPRGLRTQSAFECASAIYGMLDGIACAEGAEEESRDDSFHAFSQMGRRASISLLKQLNNDPQVVLDYIDRLESEWRGEDPDCGDVDDAELMDSDLGKLDGDELIELAELLRDELRVERECRRERDAAVTDLEDALAALSITRGGCCPGAPWSVQEVALARAMGAGLELDVHVAADGSLHVHCSVERRGHMSIGGSA